MASHGARWSFGLLLLVITAIALGWSGCAGGAASDPLAPAELVGVWNLIEEGSSEQTINPAMRALTLTVTQEGAVVYSDEPERILALRMIQQLRDVEEGVREGTAGLVTESGAVIRISIRLTDNGAQLQITDNTRLGSPNRVQVFRKVV